MKNKKKNGDGYLIWITGLSGSGKTSIAKKIFPYIKKKFGPSLLINGDDLRSIFKLFKYDLKTRFDNGIKFSNLFKLITKQKINVIFAGSGLFHKLRSYNKKNFQNYLEIYIKSDISTIIKKKRKTKIYNLKKDVYGLSLKPELPKKPDIEILNDHSKSIKFLSDKIKKEISKI